MAQPGLVDCNCPVDMTLSVVHKYEEKSTALGATAVFHKVTPVKPT